MRTNITIVFEQDDRLYVLRHPYLLNIQFNKSIKWENCMFCDDFDTIIDILNKVGIYLCFAKRNKQKDFIDMMNGQISNILQYVR